MKITLLGTGTPAPSLKSASSGYLLEIGNDVIVLDHGPGSHNRLLQLGRKSTEVTHFFLSHLHYDHCMEYPRLLLQRWDMGAGQIPELQVFGPPPIRDMTEKFIGRSGAFAPDINARIHHQGSIDIFRARGGVGERIWPSPVVREVSAGERIDGGSWSVRIAETWHAQPYLTCLGYRFETDDGSFCYAGDSGGICPEVVELATDCDVLIHMCHYYSGTEPTPEYRKMCGNHIDTAQLAERANVKTLVLTHKLEQIDQPGIRERILMEMSQHYRGNIIWGEDLLEVPLHGPRLAPMN